MQRTLSEPTDRGDTFTGNIVGKLDSVKVKHKAIFDLKELYQNLHEYFIDEKWCPREDSAFDETFHLDRTLQNGMREIWIWWRLSKKAPDSDYYKYYLDINWHIIALEDTEIVQDGKKYKSNKGEVEFIISPRVELDPEGKFAKDFLMSSFSQLFIKRIMKSPLAVRKKKLFIEVHKLRDFIKTYLGHPTYIPEPTTQRFYRDADAGYYR
jgi:hypothetical protein